jgi:hypothetical protein
MRPGRRQSNRLTRDAHGPERARMAAIILSAGLTVSLLRWANESAETWHSTNGSHGRPCRAVLVQAVRSERRALSSESRAATKSGSRIADDAA